MFWISLGAILFGSVMCWLNYKKKLVIATWIILILGFFLLPLLGDAYPYANLALQSILALVLLLAWKISDAL